MCGNHDLCTILSDKGIFRISYHLFFQSFSILRQEVPSSSSIHLNNLPRGCGQLLLVQGTNPS